MLACLQISALILESVRMMRAEGLRWWCCLFLRLFALHAFAVACIDVRSTACAATIVLLLLDLSRERLDIRSAGCSFERLGESSSDRRRYRSIAVWRISCR